jgi:hypothetical protein
MKFNLSNHFSSDLFCARQIYIKKFKNIFFANFCSPIHRVLSLPIEVSKNHDKGINGIKKDMEKLW